MDVLVIPRSKNKVIKKKYRINGGVVIKQSNMNHAVVEKDGGRFHIPPAHSRQSAKLFLQSSELGLPHDPSPADRVSSK